MEFKVGDRVVAEAESTGPPPRPGTIEEVLAEESTAHRYRVRWDDGRETIYTPAAGALIHESAAERASFGASSG